jgi:hypothetical protein
MAILVLQILAAAAVVEVIESLVVVAVQVP